MTDDGRFYWSTHEAACCLRRARCTWRRSRPARWPRSTSERPPAADRSWTSRRSWAGWGWGVGGGRRRRWRWTTTRRTRARSSNWSPGSGDPSLTGWLVLMVKTWKRLSGMVVRTVQSCPLKSVNCDVSRQTLQLIQSFLRVWMRLYLLY